MKKVLLVVLGLGVFGLVGCDYDSSSEDVDNKQDMVYESFENYSEDLSNNEYEEILEWLDEVVVIDIRTKEELVDTGVISWVDKNIDYYKSDFRQNIDNLDKDRIYVLYCNTWNRTSDTLNLMKQLGFENIYHIQNGITGWMEQGNGTLDCGEEFDFC